MLLALVGEFPEQSAKCPTTFGMARNIELLFFVLSSIVLDNFKGLSGKV